MSSDQPDRIHFASCNSQHYDQPLWPHIMERKASAFVWAGDAVYGDDFEPVVPRQREPTWLETHFPRMRVKEATPELLENLYQEQLQSPAYKEFISSEETPMVVLGTFDDHDYGTNNGDRTYRYRRESAIAHMDFVEKSNVWAEKDSSHFSLMKERAVQGKGVYGVKVMDFRRPRGNQLLSDAEAGLDPSTEPSGALSDRSVAIFLLDCRSQKTPWYTKKSEKKIKSELDYNGDFLGEEQWSWFEQAIGRSTATVNIIVQGLQVHPERYFDGHLVENWSRFPKAQHRLYQAVLRPNVQAPLLVSGDVHMAEFMRRDCRPARLRDDDSSSVSNRLLVEMTSSGMTHSWGTGVCARPHEGSICRSKFFQAVARTVMHFAHYSAACTDLLKLAPNEVTEGAKRGIQYALEKNFGEVEFDWENKRLLLRILGENPRAPPLLSTSWDFDTLSGRSQTNATGLVSSIDYVNVFNKLSSHGIANDDDWICINYRGFPSERLQFVGAASVVCLALSMTFWPLVLPALLACFMMAKKKGKTVPSTSKAV